VLAGDFLTAQAYFIKALRFHEPRGDSYELSRLYIRLSESQGRLGHLNESVRLADRSLAMARRIRSDIALIRAYGTLGQLYEKKWSDQLLTDRKKYSRVLRYYRKAESLCYKTNDSMGIAEVSAQLGVLFTRIRNRQAIPYLQRAVHLFEPDNKAGNRIDALLHLVSAYLMAGETKLASQTLDRAEKLYTNRKLDDYVLRLGMEKQRVRYHQATNQWKAAYKHLEKLNALEKSQLLADNDGTITRLNIEYETEKKEDLLKTQQRELALRAANLRTQQRFTMATAGLLAVAAGLSLLFFRLYRKKQRISRQNEELVREQNHRVKNNLQVVSSLLSLQSKRLTDEVARKAVEESRLRVQSMAILHQRLYDGDTLAAVRLDEFVRELVGGVLKAYGYPSVGVNVTIDDISLGADKAVHLGLILNELVTNVCKYAFPDNEQPELSIACGRRGHRLTLTVADNGPGLERTKRLALWEEDRPVVQSKSFGMTLIQSQVAQLHGTHQYQSATEDGLTRGTTFTMEFNS
jgi:two-component sensor histidine kinase